LLGDRGDAGRQPAAPSGLLTAMDGVPGDVGACCDGEAPADGWPALEHAVTETATAIISPAA
jgi:hypothetical protein